MESSIDFMESKDNIPHYGNYVTKQIIGYKGNCNQTNFSESNIVKVPVVEDPENRMVNREELKEIYITTPYKNVKISSVSISLCFIHKFKSSLISCG